MLSSDRPSNFRCKQKGSRLRDKYRKISGISSGLIQLRNEFFGGFINGGTSEFSLISGGRIIAGISGFYGRWFLSYLIAVRCRFYRTEIAYEIRQLRSTQNLSMDNSWELFGGVLFEQFSIIYKKHSAPKIMFWAKKNLPQYRIFHSHF